MAAQIDWSAFERTKIIDREDLIYFLSFNRDQKNAGGRVISFKDFLFLLSTLGVQSVTGNLVNNTLPQYPVVNAAVSSDVGNYLSLGTDGLPYTNQTGPPGSVLRNGTGAPSNSLGIDGDYYLDVSTGDIYEKVSGAYIIVANILGPPGPVAVSTDPNNDATLGLDGLIFVPERVQSVSGDSVDNTDPLNPIIKTPANLTFYATTTLSTVLGYFKLVTNITDPDYNTIPVDVPTGAISGTGQLLASLISAPGVFIGNPGVITVQTIGEIRRTSGSGVAEFYFELYHRDSLGTETLIGTSNLTPPVSTVAYTQFQASALLNNGIFTATDSLVTKYYANRVPGGSNPQYDFLFGGTNPVRTLFPIAAGLISNVQSVNGFTGVVVLNAADVGAPSGSGTSSGTNTGDETTLSIQTKRPIKTVNGNSLEGVGNVTIGGGNVLTREKMHVWNDMIFWEGVAGLNASITNTTGAWIQYFTNHVIYKIATPVAVNIYEAGRTGVTRYSIGGFASDLLVIQTRGFAYNNSDLIAKGSIRVSALSDGTNTYSIALGLITNRVAPSETINMTYTHSANGGKWLITVFNGTLTTTVDTGVTFAANTFYDLAIKKVGAQVDFYINGANVGTVTTNIPNNAFLGNSSLLFARSGAGTTARNVDIDYFGFEEL